MPSLAQVLARYGDLSTRVPLSMASKIFCDPIGAHPDLRAAGAPQRVDRFRSHQIHARLHFERNGCSPAVPLQIASSTNPFRFQAENVVGKPEMFGAVVVFQAAASLRRRSLATDVKVIPVNRLCAPVATVRTAAAGHDVQ